MEQTFSTLDKLPPGEDTAYLDEAESTGENEYNDENEDSDVPEEAETEEEPEELEVEPPPEDDCTDSSDLIYTVDKNTQKMYLYDPENNAFSLLGSLPCDDWGWEGDPGSMSVSRDGYAYVRYSGGLLYEVDVTNLSCEEAGFTSSSFGAFGMGYATHTNNTWQDQLYVANSDSIASLDPQSGQMTTIGNMPSQSELTGNAAGELWAFLPLEQPAQLAQIDKQTGNIIDSISLNSFSLENLDTFAFASWGGDFYLFVRLYGDSTKVFKVDRNGTQTEVLSDTGLNIVGAGVSTCAPT
jgi:hypothetical protein